MRAEKLDYLLRIERPMAGGTPWAEVATVWAERRPRSDARFIADVVDAVPDHEFIIRYLSGVTVTMRGVGVHDAKIYDFRAVLPEGRNEALRILATDASTTTTIDVVFTRQSPGTYDPATDTHTGPTTTTISGKATIVTSGTLAAYQALGLAHNRSLTLRFTPASVLHQAHTDAFVKPGDLVIINGVTYTVRDVEPVAPDGTVTVARIVVTVA